MGGHTGVYDAIKEAVETVDICIAEIIPEAIKSGYSIMITADHGNADFVINTDGTPNTAHSLNQVPCFLYAPKVKQIKSEGRLSNIAPTILRIMGLQVPDVMDEDLILF
jgi:2,3-bisphosphoglycerate-independent phosphoglycerate mutase